MIQYISNIESSCNAPQDLCFDVLCCEEQPDGVSYLISSNWCCLCPVLDRGRWNPLLRYTSRGMVLMGPGLGVVL